MPSYLSITFADHILIRERARAYLVLLIFLTRFGLCYNNWNLKFSWQKLPYAQWDSINYWVSGVLKNTVIWYLKIRDSFAYTNHFRYLREEKDHILYGCEILWYCGVWISLLSFDLNCRILKYYFSQFKIHGFGGFSFPPFPHAILLRLEQITPNLVSRLQEDNY